MSTPLRAGTLVISGLLSVLLGAADIEIPRLVSAADAGKMRGGDGSTCTSSIANMITGCWMRTEDLPNNVTVRCRQGSELDQYCVAAEYQNGIGCFRSTAVCSGAEERWNGNQWVPYLDNCEHIFYNTAGMIDESGCIGPL